MNLTLQEQETILSMSADDRSEWHVFSDDPIMQRRLESIGAEIIKTMKNGIGKEYKLRADQLTFRKGKRTLSDDQKAQLANRLRLVRAAHTAQVVEMAKLALQEERLP